MDIIVNKDGSIKTNISGTPVEGGIPADAAMVLTDPAQGNAIVYDGDKWVCGEGGGGASALSGLSDVAISGATEGDVLTYNFDAEKWVNAPAMRVYELTEETVDDDTYLSIGGECALDSSLFVNNLCWLVIDGSYYGIAQIDLPEDGDQAVHFQNGDIYTQDAETGYWVKNAAT